MERVHCRVADSDCYAILYCTVLRRVIVFFLVNRERNRVRERERETWIIEEKKDEFQGRGKCVWWRDLLISWSIYFLLGWVPIVVPMSVKLGLD